MSTVGHPNLPPPLCPAENALFLRQLYTLFLATPTEALTAEGALIVQAGSREAELLLGATGASDFETAKEPLQRLRSAALNVVLRVRSAVEVRLSSKAKGKRLHIRFWGRHEKNRRNKVPHSLLPESLTEADGNLSFVQSLDDDESSVFRPRDEERDARPVLPEKRDARPVFDREPIGIASVPILPAGKDEAKRIFLKIVGEDGVLAAIERGDITAEEVRARAADLVHTEATDEEIDEEFTEEFDAFDPDRWAADISSKLPPVEPKQRLTVSLQEELPETWHVTAQKTVAEVMAICRRYPKADRLPPPPKGEKKEQKKERKKMEKELVKLLRPGRLCVLTPSPGTGKTEGMVSAMVQDQIAGKKVGYAVLSREQIVEMKARIEKKDRRVGLQIIEGRHEGNCSNYEEVTTSAAMGYNPGTYVCPSCEHYPPIRKDYYEFRDDQTCGYYRSRLTASAERKKITNGGFGPPIYPVVLTTHSAMALGANELRDKFLGNIWDFDTIYVDEDPTAALEQTLCIDESQLTYYHETPLGQPDVHTQLTAVFREAIALGKRERSASRNRGFMRGTEPDSVHTREHGSTYSGDEWVDLAAKAAGALHPGKDGLDILTEILASVISDSIKEVTTRNVPKKGELLDLRGEDLTRKFPHRHLDPMARQMHDEITIRGDKKDLPGLRGLAYGIHLDLARINDDDFLGTGPHWGSITMHTKMRWKEQAPNIVVGDAYADIPHYQYLFDKRDRSMVDVVNFRAKWPDTATLVQVRTHASKSDVRTRDAFRDHLDANIHTALHRFERGRSVLFYVHKSHRGWLAEWLEKYSAELQLPQTAIEHWGSGRGKDIYRHFDTFVAVTEFLPNIGSLVHAANAKIFDLRLRPELPDGVISSGPAPLRIDFWKHKPRSGARKLSHMMEDQHPILIGEHERRTIDELAQAVHRIRPAIPTEDGRRKHMWIFGFRTPLSRELIAATDFVAPDGGLREMAEQQLRGQRTVTEALFTVDSSRDLAMKIGSTVERIGCWGTPFAHSAMNPLCVILSDSLDPLDVMSPNAERVVAMEEKSLSLDYYDSSPNRLFAPPANWGVLALRLSNQTLYRDAVKRVLADMPSGKRVAVKVLRPWMPRGSHGHDCIGDPARFADLLDRYYSPDALRNPVPF